MLIVDPRNNRIRRLDFREIIRAYTPLKPIELYLFYLYAIDKRKAFVALANMIPFHTLCASYEMAFLLLECCDFSDFTALGGSGTNAGVVWSMIRIAGAIPVGMLHTVYYCIL